MRDARLVRALLIALVMPCPGLLADSAWTIPGIVHANGLNGTHFVSDLTLTNPGTVAANVTLSFFPAGASSAKNLTLNPGQTVAYADVAGVTFGVSGGAGALSVSSDQPLLIRAKTYNTAQSGTYGVALPVVTSDRLLASGDVADSLWITQDPSGNAGYRTNVAVVFPDDSGGAATVTVYDSDGNARGSQDYSLDGPGLQQFSVGSFAGVVSVGRAQVAVTRGHASAYAVVVDNVTGDSSLFSFEDLPAGIQDVLVNGVARANGRNAAFFRTDGRFYNPTDTDATVQISFHANQNANLAPQTASFVVPAGKIRDVVDVLASLLNLPVGSAGALRFQSSGPVAILCRTSNVDPSGARPGTFGSQQKPAPLLSFVTSADGGAAVTGIRQDAAFRTNVGFAAGADGASYTLTLQDASGATVATTSASLGAFGWTQPGIQDLFPTTTIPRNATLNMKVTAGSVDVFDSSIDNLSGDPVVTPIAPLPVAIPSSATIGPAGGSIRSNDGRLTLRVPAGALLSSVSLSLATDASNDAPQGTGPRYTLSPGLDFAKPATLVLRYDGDDVSGSAAGELGIAFEDGSTWYVLPGGSVNPAAHTLTVPLASTAPAAPSASARRPVPAVPNLRPETHVAAVATIKIFPEKAAVLTGKTLPLLALEVGRSSSELTPGSPSSPLSSPHTPPFSTTWHVNNTTAPSWGPGGFVVPNGPNNATYWAPGCAPKRNPVEIRVEFWPALYKQLSGHVRVLARDWSLSAVYEFRTKCPGEFANDDIMYTDGFDFSLDDNLHVVNIQSHDAKREFEIAVPKACDEKNNLNLKRKGDDLLYVQCTEGRFIVNYDRFELYMTQYVPGSIGYDYTDADTGYPRESPAGPGIPFPNFGYLLQEGTYKSPTNDNLYYFLDSKKNGCP